MLSLSNSGVNVHQIKRYAEIDSTWWSAFNPSIQTDHDGNLWVAFRSSNYYFTDDYGTNLTVGNKVKNRMFIGRLDPTTLLFESNTLKEIDMQAINSGLVRGLEDPRLFYDGKDWCISATILEVFVPIAKICVIRLKSLEDPEIKSLDILLNLDPDRVEKNWMPIHKVGHAANTHFDFMYDSHTLTSKNKFTYLPENPLTRTFRGGSQIIPLDDGTNLAVIHEAREELIQTKRVTVMFTVSKRVRNYTHRFVLLDNEYNITHASDSFVFIENGIEFAAGIAQKESKIIVSFGKNDISAHLAVMDKSNIIRLLKELP